MLQPITVSADGSLLLQDGQTLDPSQLQILTDLDGQTIEGDTGLFQHLQVDLGNGQLQQIQVTLQCFSIVMFLHSMLVL